MAVAWRAGGTPTGGRISGAQGRCTHGPPGRSASRARPVEWIARRQNWAPVVSDGRPPDARLTDRWDAAFRSSRRRLTLTCPRSEPKIRARSAILNPIAGEWGFYAQDEDCPAGRLACKFRGRVGSFGGARDACVRAGGWRWRPDFENPAHPASPRYEIDRPTDARRGGVHPALLAVSSREDLRCGRQQVLLRAGAGPQSQRSVREHHARGGAGLQ